VKKVRIGISVAPVGDAGPYDEVLAALEGAGVDSLWLSDLLSASTTDPWIGMAYAVARTTRLKVGTGVTVLPGRHPVQLAKQVASLAVLAPKRVLPAFGLKPALVRDTPSFPVPGPRGEVFDEAFTLLRALLSQPRVTFHGTYFDVVDAGVGRLPERCPDLWLGGTAPAALRRIGRLADGWLASLITPGAAEAGIAAINAAATGAGREIEDDHFGISLPVAFGAIPPELAASITRRQPEADPARLVPVGWAAARAAITDYVAAGVTKFVVRPSPVPSSWVRFIEEFAAELMALEDKLSG
jgi:probable F420-dependent oxidoreductase